MTQKIAFFDLDGTFFRWQLYHELVFELSNQGVLGPAATLRLDQALLGWQAKQHSWHEYESQVVQTFEPVTASIDPTVFDKAAQAVVSRSGHKIYNYTKTLLSTLKGEGYFTLAISGSQQEIIEPFADKYDFDACIGALYERRDGKFSGNVTRYVPGRKHEIIAEFLNENPNITLEGSVAIGDSEGDVSMLQMVERPIAFNPSTGLLEEAMKHGWEIVIERKNMAYNLRKGSDGQYLLAKTDAF